MSDPARPLRVIGPVGVVQSLTSARHALGAGVGLAVVVTSYGASNYGEGARWWAAAVTILLAIALVELLAGVRRLLPVPGVAPLTLLAALAAIWLCVPETDQTIVAALVPVLVVVLEVVTRRQLGLEWYGIAAAGVLWAGMFGATGRQSALVGALFAWWAVALVPLVHAVRPIRSLMAGLAVAAIGAVAAFAVARAGGTAESGVAASVVVAAAGAVASFAVAVVTVRLSGGGSDESAGVSARP